MFHRKYADLYGSHHHHHSIAAIITIIDHHHMALKEIWHGSRWGLHHLHKL